MAKPILCVDFDGVIHSYTSGWKGADLVSDPPVPGAILWLWRATQYWDVQIYSSRSSQKGGIDAMRDWLRRHAQAEFRDHPQYMFRETESECAAIFIRELKFPQDKPAAFLTIDDRAIQFQGDWNDPELEPEALLRFKPWNKR